MKAIVIGIVLAVLLGCIPAMAGTVFTPAKWLDKEYQFQIRAGVAWYHEMDGDTDDIAICIQTPVVEWDKAYISFGGVFPVGNVEKSRPEFSISTRVGYWWEGCPNWLNWELGAYCAMSPYIPVGVQVGFVNLRF